MANQVHSMVAIASVVSASALGVHARQTTLYRDGAATSGIDIIGFTPVALTRGPRTKQGVTPARQLRQLRKGAAGCEFDRVSHLNTARHPAAFPAAAEEQSPVRLEFALGLMWLVALYGLNLGFMNISCDQSSNEETVKRSLEAAERSPSVEAPRECETREDPHPSEAPCIADSAVPQPLLDLKSLADHSAVVGETPCELLEEVRKKEDTLRLEQVDKALYESMVLKHARSLPALAVQHPTSPSAGSKGAGKSKPVNLRKNVLKRAMARGVILEGIEKLHEEVASDCTSDSRASMALVDFHHVKEQLVENLGLHEEVAPGSPAWKRLCRVVSFLRRNVDAAPL